MCWEGMVVEGDGKQAPLIYKVVVNQMQVHMLLNSQRNASVTVEPLPLFFLIGK